MIAGIRNGGDPPGKNTRRDYLDARLSVAERDRSAEYSGYGRRDRSQSTYLPCPVIERYRNLDPQEPKQKGIRVTGDLPHYLIYSEEDVIRGKGCFQMFSAFEKSAGPGCSVGIH